MKRVARLAAVGLLLGVIGGGLVKAQPPIGDVKPVAKGEAVVGENRGGFDEGGANIWKYNGKAGEVLTLMAAAENPANNTDNETRQQNRLLDTVLVVYDPTNQVIAYNDDIVDAVLTNSFLRYVELKTDGVYSIKVTNWFTENGDETGGHFTLTLWSNKVVQSNKKIALKTLGKLDTATDVMDEVEGIINDVDTRTVMLINPSFCTIKGATFGDLKFDLKPYSGIVISAPVGWYSLNGKGDLCTLNTDEFHVPETTTVMVVPIDRDGTRPANAPEFPTDSDALANS
ncbi:MAG: hypothetical protein GC179_01650 [Anaerolineaceae bacterium]|nr:hypothetical protein [Anaerolineaceae bacterium]